MSANIYGTINTTVIVTKDVVDGTINTVDA